MYSKEITRCHRAAIVIAIDQSSSMSGRMEMNGWELSKAEMVSIVTGRLIDELILRSHRDDGYRHYYDIALLGYSDDKVESLLGEKIEFSSVVSLAEREIRKTSYRLTYKTIDNKVCTLCEEVSLWVEPRAQGSTPMYNMINRVTELVEEWCAQEENRNSFPPIVINITDGEASDANYDMLRCAAARLKSTGTTDGHTLFVNVHISLQKSAISVTFPSISEVPLSIRYAHLLMDLSSVMPEQFNEYIVSCRGHYSSPPYIAMSYNASISELIAMLNIGSRSSSIGL